MDIIISGYKGFMGKEVEKSAYQKGINVKMSVDANVDGSENVRCVKDFAAVDVPADCIIDFSHRSLTNSLLDFAVKNRIPAVIATTGQTNEEINAIAEASRIIPLFFSPNYSLGVAVLIESAKKIVSCFPEADVEIVEYHHNRKADAPSGTAKSIFDEIKTVRENAFAVTDRADSGKRQKNEIGISSVRMGNICGIHEIYVSTPSQTITLRHEAHNRGVFADGAISAAEFLVDQKSGLYTMKDLL